MYRVLNNVDLLHRKKSLNAATVSGMNFNIFNYF